MCNEIQDLQNFEKRLERSFTNQDLSLIAREQGKVSLAMQPSRKKKIAKRYKEDIGQREKTKKAGPFVNRGRPGHHWSS